MLVLHHSLLILNIILNIIRNHFEEVAFQTNRNPTQKTNINILVLKHSAEVTAVTENLPREPGYAAVLPLQLFFDAVPNM